MSIVIKIGVLVCFIFNSVFITPAMAQVALAPQAAGIPLQGEVFTPAHLRGMVIDPQKPFEFDFLVHKGDASLSDIEKKAQYADLVKYFLAALTVPDNDQWVNLSPFEQERIIPDSFGLNEMGRQFLEQDYLLKQLSASLTHPDTALGAQFWSKVYARAREKFGTVEIEPDAFNKVWIVPDDAAVLIRGDRVFVTRAHLKVMLDDDYRAMQSAGGQADQKGASTRASLSTDSLRELIVPAIEKEVN